MFCDGSNAFEKKLVILASYCYVAFYRNFLTSFFWDMDKTIEQLLKDLQGLRNEFNDFLYYLPDALLEIDLLSRRLTYMNRMASILFGYSEKDFSSGIALVQLFDGKEFERAVTIIKSYVASSLEQKAEYTRSGRTDLYEFMMRRKDGSIFPAETQTSFVLDKNHVPVAMRTIVRDISERRQAQPRRSAELQALTTNLPGEYLQEIMHAAEALVAQAPAGSFFASSGQQLITAAQNLARALAIDFTK